MKFVYNDIKCRFHTPSQQTFYIFQQYVFWLFDLTYTDNVSKKSSTSSFIFYTLSFADRRERLARETTCEQIEIRKIRTLRI